MENTLCIDTDILIDFLRKKKDAVQSVSDYENRFALATTIINVYELYTGFYKSLQREHNLKALSELLNKLIILNLSFESARLAGKHRARLEEVGTPLESRDILIAAISLASNVPLLTNNKKHFERIHGLRFAA